MSLSAAQMNIRRSDTAHTIPKGSFTPLIEGACTPIPIRGVRSWPPPAAR